MFYKVLLRWPRSPLTLAERPEAVEQANRQLKQRVRQVVITGLTLGNWLIGYCDLCLLHSLG